jgi:hypothetical protein
VDYKRDSRGKLYLRLILKPKPSLFLFCEHKDKVIKEVQRQIDIAIEEILHEKNRWSKSTAKSKLQYNTMT